MAKWADYVITGVSYDSKHTRIEKVEIRRNIQDDIISPSPQIITREMVISYIKNGSIIITATWENRRWHKGMLVKRIVVNGIAFIRTEGNNEPYDNLGNLPEF